MSAAGIAAGPCFRDDEVVADEHVAARNMLVEMPRTDGVDEPVLVPGNPVKLTNVAEGPETRIPWLGEHTDAVLAEELGLGDDELARSAGRRHHRLSRHLKAHRRSTARPLPSAAHGAGSVLELRRAGRGRIAARRPVGRRRPRRGRRPRDHRQPPLLAGRRPGARPRRLAGGTRPPRAAASPASCRRRSACGPTPRTSSPCSTTSGSTGPCWPATRWAPTSPPPRPRSHRDRAGRTSCSSTVGSPCRSRRRSTRTPCSPASSARRWRASR